MKTRSGLYPLAATSTATSSSAMRIRISGTRCRSSSPSRFHREVYQHLCLDEASVFFTSNADLSATCNALQRENKQHRDRRQIAEAALQTRGPEAQRIVYLQQELDKAHRVARGRILEDLQTREYTDRVHLHNHSLLQKINFLADSNRQLKSLHTLQQHQQKLQQVGCFCCCFQLRGIHTKLLIMPLLAREMKHP